MAVEIVVPELGESIVEATVVRWLKNEGDPVKNGEPVVELETDKVDLEVPAAADGILARVMRQAGEDVTIGDVLGVIEAGAAAPSPPPVLEEAAPAAQGEEVAPLPGEGERVTPVAKRLAEERGVDLAQVTGSGPGGRVTKIDIERFLEQPVAPAPAKPAPAKPAPAKPAPAKPAPAAAPPAPQAMPGAPQPREERVKMSRRRRTIAQRLVEAQHTAAMLTTFNEIDMGRVMDMRKRRRDSFEKQHGVRLGFMSFFTKAVIGALKAYPRLNAEIDGDEMVLKYHYDIGIAVGAEEGLVVPVLRDADRMTFAEIEHKIREFASKVREGGLSLADLQGGTFTITNGGVFGSLLSTPILNPPQVGILGLHKIEERPVVVNGEIVVRPMMYVALSYDHRIVDGSEAVQFLVKVKELIEDPEALLLEG